MDYYSILQTIGGLGIFLIGMTVMTDGLKSLAGDALRNTLTRFTHSPVSGAVTGAVSTAILQSSSATTVAAVGFVGASLLTFPQALGIIFGANLGTTATGWIVAILGFKLKLGHLVLPLIFAGALMRLFLSGRLASLGVAIAGFGLIFVGIANLQTGMSSYEGALIPSDFPSPTFTGGILLFLLGMGITILTQSSSAGVATALTAVSVGTIEFSQAAMMVIGMDVGTTVTAAIATLGGSAETRRTGYSHVIYNLLTASMAFALLGFYVDFVSYFWPGLLMADPGIALVAFHSLFNGIGVLLILPFTSHFAALLYRLVPDKKLAIIDKLDRLALNEPIIALTLLSKSLEQLALASLEDTKRVLQGKLNDNERVTERKKQLDFMHQYADEIRISPEDRRHWKALTASIHSLDHLSRLHDRCHEDAERGQPEPSNPFLYNLQISTLDEIRLIYSYIENQEITKAVELAKSSSEHINQVREATRTSVMQEIAAGKIDIPSGKKQLESLRWLKRVSYHIWRISEHLETLAKL